MAFLTEDNIFTVWEQTKKKIDKLTEPFSEYQRIARNLPRPDADPDYPNVTDGTAASIIQKTPKRIIQQLPVGEFELYERDDNEKWDWLPIIAQDVYENRIIPNADEDYGLFDKSQLVVQNGLTFGNSVSYAPFINHNGEFTPDLTLPYWGDIYPQPGKKSIRSAKYIFIRSWWTKEDIEDLIKSEAKNAKSAKKNGEKYESTWDTAALESIKTKLTEKDEKAKTPHEEERSSDSEGIEIITGFQVGVKAKFYSFNPDAKKICRTKLNKDPRGKMPLDVFYGDIDGSNPLGRSLIDLIGPLQNLIDSDMQAYQYNRALSLQPPVIKYGNVGNFSFAPNEVLDASNDPNAKVVPLVVDTTAIANYPQLYGLQKSQILNLVASPDTSISAEVGNPGFSKTHAGVKQQQSNISVDDNAIRKSWEKWFEDWSETGGNIYFAERSGTEVLTLQDKTVAQLEKLIKDDKLPADFLNGNQVIMDYDDDMPALRFRIAASTSKMADDATKLQALQLVQASIDSSPTLQQLLAQYPDKLIALYNSLISLSGVEDPEKLTISDDEQEALAQQQMQQQQAEQAQAEEEAMQQQQMQEEQAQQPQLSESDMQIVQQLQQLGFDDNTIGGAIQQLNSGVSDMEVMQSLGLGN